MTDIAQKVDLRVDRNGIVADAELVVGAMIAGLFRTPETFHVKLNRPFLFFVRDKLTHATLFLGAVMDPTLR